MPANSDPPALESVEERPVTFGTVVVRSLTSRTRFPVALVCLALVAAGCTGLVASETREQGIHKIQHVIVIMQENRSFDSYFGTHPGADGIPMRHGRPDVCVPDPRVRVCVKPFHDPSLINEGGPHGELDAARYIDGRRLDPATDGRPDSRPDVRENDPALGNLLADFDFSQPPSPPLILPPYPT
jgi:hypothetical protein